VSVLAVEWNGLLCSRVVAVTFELVSEEAFDGFLEWTVDSYSDDISRVDAMPYGAAREKATDEIGRLLPKGPGSENHTLCRIMSATPESVGSIWYGPDRMKDRSALFLYDIVIDREHRRMRYASAAIERLREEGRLALVDGFALHVFDNNTAAISLYDRHGFVVGKTAPGHVLMVKAQWNIAT
jgi:ribosomal protein S18 acetylase RimI-like enzyme